MLNQEIAFIDSTQLRIPLHKVELFDPRLKGNIVTLDYDPDAIDENGEKGKFISQDLRKPENKHHENGISSYSLVTRTNFIHEGEKHWLYLSLNSKMLQEDYLKGLTEDTLWKAYDYLIGLKQYYFTYETFYKAECWDTDITNDQKMTLNDKIKEMVLELANSKSNYTGQGCEAPKNKKIIQFNKRKGRGIGISKPFGKIYDKATELKEKSYEFAETYGIKIEDNLTRFEFTLKNRKHLDYYGLPNTLGALANSDLLTPLKDMLRKNMNDEKPKERDTSENISIKEALMISHLRYGEKLDKNFQEIFEDIWRETSGYKNVKNERYKFKSELKKVYEEKVLNSDYIPEDGENDMQIFFDFLYDK